MKTESATWQGTLHDSRYHTSENGRVLDITVKAEFETVYRAHGGYGSSYYSIDVPELEPVTWSVHYNGLDITDKLNGELIDNARDIVNDYTFGHREGWS
jgi:hypothetical protein